MMFSAETVRGIRYVAEPLKTIGRKLGNLLLNEIGANSTEAILLKHHARSITNQARTPAQLAIAADIHLLHKEQELFDATRAEWQEQYYAEKLPADLCEPSRHDL